MTHDWTAADRQYLRKLRIEPGSYPSPLPRFSVEMTLEGHVGMYDARCRRLWLFLAEHFSDPQASAEDVARQMNALEDEERGKEQHG